MKKIINDPNKYLSEMLEGIYIAHQNQLTYVNDDPQCLVTKTKKAGKVGIATGGGSGHLPLFLGYVGDGMLDGCSVGDVFQSPSAEQMHAITKEIDSGAGVLYIYGNYNGDIFNFDMAAEMADFEDGIRVETVLGADDVASIGPLSQDEKTTRRGVAGIFFVYKCAGAAADKMMSLDTVTRIARKASWNTRTLGVALTSCVVPRVGHAGFHIEEDEMEIGMGQHGEGGGGRQTMKSADETAKIMLDGLLADLDIKEGEKIMLILNGTGATTLMELFIIYRRCVSCLKEKNVEIVANYVGELLTVQEQAGFQMFMARMDDELLHYWNAPCNTPYMKK